jgi:hypothetical protein
MVVVGATGSLSLYATTYHRYAGIDALTSVVTLSAYLSLYEDSSLLGAALASVGPLVDEIVVVDGAYEWMRPFLAGGDPRRSGPRVEAALAPYRDKLRVVSGTWANEVEKRQAGFAACQHRFVLRLDADEVLVPDLRTLRRVRDAGSGVGQAAAPIMATPEWMQAPAAGGMLPRLGVLFDRDRVSARDHLAYLWLVLPDAERADIPPPDPGLIAPDPVGFLAHLTLWRTPGDAAQRARFYVLNYVRETGRLPLLPNFALDRDGFAGLLGEIGPESLAAHFQNHPIVAGALDMVGHELRPAPADLSPSVLAPLHAAFLGAQAVANRRLCADGRPFAQGEPISLDATGPDALPALKRDGTLQVELSHRLTVGRLRVQWLLAAPPWSVEAEGAARGDGRLAAFVLPPDPPGPILRRVVTLYMWLHGAGVFGRFRPIACL